MFNFVVRHRRFFALYIVASIIGIVATTAAIQYDRPIPEMSLVQSQSLTWTPPEAAEIAWPSQGQAVIALEGAGIIGESPNQKPQPIASLTKVMTAYVILKNHPLVPGVPGPDIQLQDHHVVNYQTRKANAESVVAVTAGASLTQLDLLRGLMIASANNMADVLAEWHSGSVEAFVQEMNAEAKALGMEDTVYADAAGLLPGSQSTAHDQLILATAVMADPIFASIVRETEAPIPGAGVVYNTNSALGSSGIVGIKTGWTEEAGACLMFAAEWDVNGQTERIVGVVLGQTVLEDAFNRSRELILLGGAGVNMVTIGNQGDTVGEVTTEWGATTNAVLAEDVSLLMVPGLNVTAALELAAEGDIVEGEEIGSIEYVAGAQVINVPLLASSTVEAPDLEWRLTRLP